jgi:squalene/oxidosqualene cyclase-like protein
VTSTAAETTPDLSPEPATRDPLRAPAAAAYARALDHLRAGQQPKGAVAGEVVWNPMLPCQYVILCRILGVDIPAARRRRIHLALARQVRPDGGWGMHPDSPSWLFHTTLGYVALRLLGHDDSDPLVAGSLRWIRQHGGVLGLPTWGRIWLALLGLYPWSGVQPILPEMWLLPDAAPMHPRRLYCHMRLIYLGVSYAYGARITAATSPLVESIRSELYPEGYARTRFAEHRDDIAATDLYEAPGAGLRAAFAGLRALDRLSPGRLRRRALARAMDHILFEFHSTGHVCLSPVNGLLFCLALHHHDPRHPELPAALRGLEYWFWEDDVDGLRICGARSDIWDTAFLLQAIAEGPSLPVGDAIARDAGAWLPIAQHRGDIPGGADHYRDPADGGWGFADEHHPWPVSDCTAEALEALLHTRARGNLPGGLPLERQRAAVRFILGRQNADGGFGSYEPRRGSMVLRHFNPAEIYGNCMLEYSYSECTASCIRGLAVVRTALGAELGGELRGQVDASIDRGAAALLAQQHANGAWAGFWGIHFTYGTFFAVHGLLAAGLSPHHPSIRRALEWLLAAQRPDGGWAESFEGNLHDRDIQLPPGDPSSVTQTAWAALTLMALKPRDDRTLRAIDRAIELLVDRLGQDGWPQEPATGVFFNTAVLDYKLYRQIFPAWALARYVGRAA